MITSNIVYNYPKTGIQASSDAFKDLQNHCQVSICTLYSFI